MKVELTLGQGITLIGALEMVRGMTIQSVVRPHMELVGLTNKPYLDKLSLILYEVVNAVGDELAEQKTGAKLAQSLIDGMVRTIEALSAELKAYRGSQPKQSRPPPADPEPPSPSPEHADLPPDHRYSQPPSRLG